MDKYRIDWYTEKVYIRRRKRDLIDGIAFGGILILMYQIFMTAGRVAAILQG